MLHPEVPVRRRRVDSNLLLTAFGLVIVAGLLSFAFIAVWLEVTHIDPSARRDVDCATLDQTAITGLVNDFTRRLSSSSPDWGTVKDKARSAGAIGTCALARFANPRSLTTVNMGHIACEFNDTTCICISTTVESSAEPLSYVCDPASGHVMWKRPGADGWEVSWLNRQSPARVNLDSSNNVLLTVGNGLDSSNSALTVNSGL